MISWPIDRKWDTDISESSWGAGVNDKYVLLQLTDDEAQVRVALSAEEARQIVTSLLDKIQKLESRL